MVFIVKELSLIYKLFYLLTGKENIRKFIRVYLIMKYRLFRKNPEFF